MPITNAQEIFAYALGNIYDAEHRFLEGQQQMVEQATDRDIPGATMDLKGAIQQHIEETRKHIENLEQVFGSLDLEPRRETNEVAQGLVSEAQQGIQEAQNDNVRDFLINAAMVKVEHYEIASYRALIPAARMMGVPNGEYLLGQNLQEEEQVAQIAEDNVEELLRKTQGEESRQQEQQAQGGQGEDKGLIDQAKDKLTGQ